MWPKLNALSRRDLMAAGLAAPLVSAFHQVDPLTGVEAYSESVQVGLASLDGTVQVVARLCRYPDAGRGWTWIQVMTPQGFFASFDHHAPCGPEYTAHNQNNVVYSVAGVSSLTATRHGSRLEPTACEMRIGGYLAATSFPREGESGIPFSARITIEPTRRYAGLLPNRSEVFGPGAMELEINGQPMAVEGFGQFHEQPQTTPRFSQPYGYASLWGPRTGVTIVASPQGGGGYRASDTTTAEFRRVEFGVNGDSPRLIVLSAGTEPDLTLSVTQRSRQTMPIFNGTWRGAFVQAEAPGETFYGVAVDFS